MLFWKAGAGWWGESKVLRKGNENREVLRVAQGRYSNSGGTN